MDQDAITRYIVDTFEGVHADASTPDTFFFFDPEGRFPFATIVTRDTDFDGACDLDRPGVFRLNIGVSGATTRALFGAPDGAEQARDATALDCLMPHPVYGRMHWVCVLNPSDETFEARVAPLLTEAYALSVRKHGKRKQPPTDEA